MKKIFLAAAAIATLIGTPALAADMALKPAAPPPVSSWTGFYVGVQGGSGWGTSQFNATSWNACGIAAPSVCAFPSPGLTFNNSAVASYGINGWFGGVTAGYNWQNGPVVLGVEGDISDSSIEGRGDCTAAFPANVFIGAPGTTGCHTKMTWFATATGRLGFMAGTTGDTLIYVKGGGAWAHFNQEETGAVNDMTPIALASASVGDSRWGGTAGVGIEYRFWHNWSAKLEYDYMDFGNRNITFNGTTPLAPGLVIINNEKIGETVSVVRAGVNYEFGGL